MNSLSFDGLATLYDETRCFDRRRFQEAVQYLCECFPAHRFPHLMEAGIGTGRIALPLAEKGYTVTGVDLSWEMLATLKGMITAHPPAQPIRPALADVTCLPLPAAAFDLALVVHLFYFVRNWQQAADEIKRVVRSGGAVILMHTGTGMEIPILNERYKVLCREKGYPIEAIGVKSTREVVAYYQAQGCRVESIRGRWGWLQPIQIGTALGYLQKRAYSFTVTTPEPVHQSTITQMGRELAGQMDKTVDVPNEIYLEIISG